MTLPASRFLDPATLVGIRDLRLVARAVVEGMLAGLHPDARPGAGVEFSQYRAYEPGDDLRRVDWRAYARSDRFVVRQSDVEREVTVRVILDATASMGHQDAGRSTFDYARLLAACLAYLADRQGDRLAFHAVRDGGSVDLLPAERGRTLRRALGLLDGLAPSGRWPRSGLLAPRLRGRRARALDVLVSDLHEEAGEIRATVDRLRGAGDEVMVVHLRAPNEITFPFQGDLVFEDLETGRQVRGQAAALRPLWLAARRRHEAEWARDMAGTGVVYERVSTGQPLDRALRSFLTGRRRLP